MFLLKIKDDKSCYVKHFLNKYESISAAMEACSTFPGGFIEEDVEGNIFFSKCGEYEVTVKDVDKEYTIRPDAFESNLAFRNLCGTYTGRTSCESLNMSAPPKNDKSDEHCCPDCCKKEQDLYRHFKGDIYRIICKSISEANPKDRMLDLIIYTKADGNGPIWHRPAHEFYGYKGKLKRFTKLPKIEV